MENTAKLIGEVDFLALIGAVTLPKFFGIKSYRNNEGELSNYTVLLGNDYGAKKEADADKLRAEIERLTATNEPADSLRYIAAQKLLLALENNLKKETASNQSIAQSETYHNVCPNVRQHKATGEFYAQGFRVNKKVLEAIDYGPDTRRPLTKAQDQLKKDLNLLSYTYRQFSLGKLTETRLNGETLEVYCDGSALVAAKVLKMQTV